MHHFGIAAGVLQLLYEFLTAFERRGSGSALHIAEVVAEHDEGRNLCERRKLRRRECRYARHFDGDDSFHAARIDERRLFGEEAGFGKFPGENRTSVAKSRAPGLPPVQSRVRFINLVPRDSSTLRRYRGFGLLAFSIAAPASTALFPGFLSLFFARRFRRGPPVAREVDDPTVWNSHS